MRIRTRVALLALCAMAVIAGSIATANAEPKAKGGPARSLPTAADHDRLKAKYAAKTDAAPEPMTLTITRGGETHKVVVHPKHVKVTNPDGSIADRLTVSSDEAVGQLPDKWKPATRAKG